MRFFQTTTNYSFYSINTVWRVFSKWVEVWADHLAEAELEVEVEVITVVALEIAEAIVGAGAEAGTDAIDLEQCFSTGGPRPTSGPQSFFGGPPNFHNFG